MGKLLAAKLWARPRVWPVSWPRAGGCAENHLQRRNRGRHRARIRLLGRGEERLSDQDNPGGAEAPEGHVALDDFAIAGIDDGGAVTPSTRVAIDPLDDVVADVHGIGVFGEESTRKVPGAQAGGLEG